MPYDDDLARSEERSSDVNSADVKDAAVDLSTAVLLFRYFRFWRRIVLIAALFAGFWALTGRSLASAGAAIGFGGLYVAFRRYYRPALLAFSWAMIPACAAIAAWALWKSVALLQRSLNVWLAIPLSVIASFLYISHRVLQQSIESDDMPYRKPSDPFYIAPSFSAMWLSGGWRTGLALATPWYIWNSFIGATPDQVNGCLLFGIFLFAVALDPWVLIPSARAVWTVTPVELLRAITRSQPKAVNHSYTLFLLREGLKQPIAAAGVLILAIVLMAVALASVLFLWRILGILPILAALTAWAFCSRLATRYVLGKAASTIQLASEPFTLYLRSFIDDDFRVLRDGLLYRVWLVDQLFNALRYTRFEEVLTGTVWPYGRLVTLSRPGSKLPDIGALRVRADPEHWQQTIMQFVDSANRVVMAVGFSSGLRWELAQFDTARLAKLTLAFVPEHPEETLATWRQFTLEAPRLSLCREEVITKALAARFRDDGSLVFVTARKRSLVAYQLAILSCFVPAGALEPFIELKARPRNSGRRGAITV
jgi:hypothetical protein